MGGLVEQGFDEYKYTATTRVHITRHGDEALMWDNDGRVIEDCERRGQGAKYHMSMKESDSAKPRSSGGETVAAIEG